MTTPTLNHVVAPDQSDRAAELITTWLAWDPEAQDLTLARMIAAALHAGHGTALERFAATGRLDAPRALDELNHVEVPIEREGWVDALGRYVIAAPSS